MQSTRGRAMSISAILEAHHGALDDTQKNEFLRELEEQCKAEAGGRSTRGQVRDTISRVMSYLLSSDSLFLLSL